MRSSRRRWLALGLDLSPRLKLIASVLFTYYNA
jgi:hypothetical protein